METWFKLDQDKKKKKEDEIMNEEENTSLLRRIATKLGQKEDLMRVA